MAHRDSECKYLCRAHEPRPAKEGCAWDAPVNQTRNRGSRSDNTRGYRMEGKLRVMIGSQDSAVWRMFTNIPEAKDFSLVRFRSIQEARGALAQENVLLIFCESRLVDGTYEDLLAAAKNVRSQARIVVAGLDADQFDSLGYCRARQLGAFDVLRKSYGIRDLEWVVICAIRDELGPRSAAWHGRN